MSKQLILDMIKDKSERFAEEIKYDINHLCNQLDYKNSSVVSYNIDRLEAYINGLNETKITE